MMRSDSLLNRIGRGAEITPVSSHGDFAEDDYEDLSDSVCRHLVRLLNSRHAMSKAAPDYGLPALADFDASKRSLRRIQAEIKRTVETYEPRLRSVSVTWVDSETTRGMKFRVEGNLVGRSAQYTVWYEASLGSSPFRVLG